MADTMKKLTKKQVMDRIVEYLTAEIQNPFQEPWIENYCEFSHCHIHDVELTWGEIYNVLLKKHIVIPLKDIPKLKLKFYHCILTKCKFNELPARLEFEHSVLKNCDFSGCFIEQTNFIFSEIYNGTFKKCQMARSKFAVSDLQGTKIEYCYMANTFILQSEFYEVDFVETILDWSTMKRSTMAILELLNCSLKDMYFENVDWTDVAFKGSTALDETSVHGINFTNYNNISLIPDQTSEITISKIGSRKDTTYYNYEKDLVICGCWKAEIGQRRKGGTLAQFERRVNQVYPDGQYHDEYMNAIAVFKTARQRYLDSKKGNGEE